jgi:hypothetical protein
VIDSVMYILIVIPTNVVKPPAEMNCPNTTASIGTCYLGPVVNPHPEVRSSDTPLGLTSGSGFTAG